MTRDRQSISPIQSILNKLRQGDIESIEEFFTLLKTKYPETLENSDQYVAYAVYELISTDINESDVRVIQLLFDGMYEGPNSEFFLEDMAIKTGASVLSDAAMHVYRLKNQEGKQQSDFNDSEQHPNLDKLYAAYYTDPNDQEKREEMNQKTAALKEKISHFTYQEKQRVDEAFQNFGQNIYPIREAKRLFIDTLDKYSRYLASHPYSKFIAKKVEIVQNTIAAVNSGDLNSDLSEFSKLLSEPQRISHPQENGFLGVLRLLFCYLFSQRNLKGYEEGYVTFQAVRNAYANFNNPLGSQEISTLENQATSTPENKADVVDDNDDTEQNRPKF